MGIEHEAMNRRRRKIGRKDLDEVGEMEKERGSQDAESGKWFWLAVRSREIAIGRNFLLAAPAVAQKGKAAVFPFWQPGANPRPGPRGCLDASIVRDLAALLRF